MSPHLVFRKVTPDGLAVEIQEFDGYPLLLLGQQKHSGPARPVQIMGIAKEEKASLAGNWYYEYDPLPKTLSLTRVTKWLQEHGYVVGVFDQFGNFRRAA
ncbi:MAG: hypothetical protein H5T69_15060 [Chloroflexi bacterium]|nr:hypothetical protein [Chloroflexota bacterium]